MIRKEPKLPNVRRIALKDLQNDGIDHEKSAFPTRFWETYGASYAVHRAGERSEKRRSPLLHPYPAS